jgi:hypothetical protein
MLAAVTRLNHQLARLAPVLNAPTLADAVSVETDPPSVPVAVMVKRHDATRYLFTVAMQGKTVEATFRLADKTATGSVEVLDEDRQLPLQAGVFRDTFQPWEVHLYRMPETNR